MSEICAGCHIVSGQGVPTVSEREVCCLKSSAEPCHPPSFGRKFRVWSQPWDIRDFEEQPENKQTKLVSQGGINEEWCLVII